MSELYVALPAGVAVRFTAQRPELREAGGAQHIAGYASVFGKKSRNLGGFVEQIDRRAFDQPMVNGWPGVICRYNHDDNYLLGTTQGNTLSLRVDDTGLWYDVIPPSFRKDIVELCARGDVTQSSFAFRVPDGGDYWERSGPGGMPMRTVMGTELIDVAPVNTPAYTEATASARSLTEDEDILASLARYAESSQEEVRSYLSESGNVSKFFKRSDASDKATDSQRAAKASYSDLETCGECGSTNEYGKYCSGCGASMSNDKPAGKKFCTNCGGKITGNRADHVCDAEERAVIKKRGELPDSDFAYVEPGHDGEKVDGRTPDKYRHFPLIDANHVRNALSQAPKSPFGAKALPKIKAAAKKLGIEMDEQNSLLLESLAELRDQLNDDEELRGDLPPWLKKGKDGKVTKADGDSGDDDDEDEKDGKKDTPDSKTPAKTEKKSSEDDAEARAAADTDSNADDDEDEADETSDSMEATRSAEDEALRAKMMMRRYADA